MATELGGDADLSASLILLSTLVSMVTIPLWVWFMGL
jgi:predicted permease